MARPEQNRPALRGKSKQQIENAPAASLVAMQIIAIAAASSMPPEKDLAICDASGGAFNLALPAVGDAIVGKPYCVREVDGTNAVTLTTPGSETIDGANTFVVQAGGYAELVLVEQPEGTFTWRVMDDGDAAPDAGVRTVAPGENVVATATDRSIEFSSDGGGAATIDLAALPVGESIWLVMTAFDTDAYTVAVTGGTLTFNATGEAALVYRSSAGLHAFLAGATIV